MIQLPYITKNLLIINLLIFFATQVNFTLSGYMHEYLDLYYFLDPSFKPWQLISYMFMHADFNHVVGNMIGVLFCGQYLESVWGPKKFLNFYLMCGIGAALAYQGLYYFTHEPSDIGFTLLGASGAVFGLLFAVATLNPNARVMLLFPPIPMKMIVLVSLYTLLEIYLMVRQREGDNVAHFAHLAGLAVAAIILLIWKSQNKLYS